MIADEEAAVVYFFVRPMRLWILELMAEDEK